MQDCLWGTDSCASGVASRAKPVVCRGSGRPGSPSCVCDSVGGSSHDLVQEERIIGHLKKKIKKFNVFRTIDEEWTRSNF